MRTGKIPESILKRSILKYIKNDYALTEDCGQIGSAALGEDCAFINLNSQSYLSISAQPVIVTNVFDVERGMAGTINNLAAAGARPMGITISLMLPTKTEEPFIKEIMKQAADFAAVCHIVILGGHTEISEAVSEVVMNLTAIGIADRTRTIYRPVPGDDILMTKWIGMEETCLLAIKREEELLTRYPQHMINAAKDFKKNLLITTEAATAIQSGSCRMHDLRCGGIFNALWELGQNAGVGLTVDLKKIPIRQETVEIGEFFDVNPYEMLSSGALLIVSPQGEKLKEMFTEQRIESELIGRITEGNDRIITNEEETRYLGPLK